MEAESYRSHSEEETFRLGTAFAERLRTQDVVMFFGDLGAGKTEFIKGISHYFNVEEIVSSPTFTVMNQYTGETPENDEITIYHVDLYRIKSEEELDEIGFRDCMYSEDTIKLVKWSENAGNLIPDIRWTVHISFDADNENDRVIVINHIGEETPQYPSLEATV